MRHRSDIEGLRGVAIAVVVAFHFAPEAVPGGRFGVDLFFVLSGYLITGIVAADLDAGRFSFAEFYRRRVARILPALLAMVVAVVLAGAWLLLPSEAHDLATAGAALAAFVGNFQGWAAGGYFQMDQLRPLFHGWSLGVEEQAYFAYPLVLWLVQRWRPQWRRPVLAVATVASALLCAWLELRHAGMAFYLLPARAWELTLGGWAALGPFAPRGSDRARPVLAAGGLGLLLAAFVFAPLPAAWMPDALPAAIATALLLAYGERGPAARLLSLAPLRWLGRISYSLYLWHVPVRELYRATVDPMPDLRASLALIGAALLLAICSYRWIERPAQRALRAAPHAGAVVLGGVGAAAAVAAFCLALGAAVPRLTTLPPRVARVAAFADYAAGPAMRYQAGPSRCWFGQADYDAAYCLRPDPRRRNVAVIGDSHALHLWRVLAERFPRDKVMLAASSGCRPVFGGPSTNPRCTRLIETLRHGVIAGRRVQAVVLAGNWVAADLPHLAPTLREIRAAGVDVTLIGPVVQYRAPVPRMLAYAMLGGRLHRSPEALRAPLPAQLDQKMRTIAAGAGVRYFSLYDAECPRGACRLLTPQRTPFHFDTNHLTLDGARALVARLPEP